MEASARAHALLFGVLAQEIRRARPGDYPVLLQSAVETYGLQRGRRMGQAADACGFGRTMLAYLACGELPPSPGAVTDVAGDDPVVWHVTACPWQAAWAGADMTDVGTFYCRFIDESVVRGFSPDLRLTTGETLTAGGPWCLFRWNGASLAGGGRAALDAMTEKARPLCLRPWTYHMAHLYKTVGDVLEAQAGPEVRAAVFAAADARLDPETAAALRQGLDQDYDVNPALP